MPIPTRLIPLRSEAFGLAEARHLLIRAGFGPSPADLQVAVRDGLEATLDGLVAYDQLSPPQPGEPDVNPDYRRPYTDQEQVALRTARQRGDQATLDRLREEQLGRERQDRRQFVRMQQWWIERMARTNRPLEEQLTLLWHSHFASRQRDVQDAYMMWQQHRLLRENAAGSFSDMAVAIVRDPAMLRFLNNDRNIKSNPNENLARELMELFTLGEGNYTERDIFHAARALTGYTYDDHTFQFRANYHDDASNKRILGRRGPFNGDYLARYLVKQEACSQFVAFKLYRHFVADLPDNRDRWQRWQVATVNALSGELRRNEMQIAPTVRSLLGSTHFFDPAVRGNKVKPPAQLLAGTVTSMNLPWRSSRLASDAMQRMGQELFNPPTVAGWDVGRPWINTSTLFARQNVTAWLIANRTPDGNWDRSKVGHDPGQLLDGLDSTEPYRVVDHLVDAYLGPHTPPQRRKPLVDFLDGRENPTSRDALVGLLLLIAAAPEYQLC
ncbi:MAG: DUF1800 domain-containing protein [Planctomycetota bacterium]